MISALLAAGGQVPKIPADWPGWLILIVIGFLGLRVLLKWLGILK